MRPGPTLRALAVLAVFLGLFLVIDQLSGGGSGEGSAPTASPGATAAPTTAQPPTTTAPTTTRAPATTTTRRPTTTREEEEGAGEPPATRPRSPEGVTVQVLNGNWTPGLARRVAERVRAAGYTVVATNTAYGTFTKSRIFYTAGHLEDAEAFRARFPQFSLIEPAAGFDLSREVDLHVVIGQDYPTDDP